MKTQGRLILVLMALIGMTFSIQAEAGTDVLRWLKPKEVSSKTKARALRTVQGAVVSLSKIVNTARHIKGNAKEVLRRAQIELTDGSIIYPEEVESFLAPAKKKIRAWKGPSVSREPNGDDE